MDVDPEMMRTVLKIGRLKPYASPPRTAEEHAEKLIEQIEATESYFHQEPGPKRSHHVVADSKDLVFVFDCGTGPRSDLFAKIASKMWNALYDYAKAQRAKELKEREERGKMLGLDKPKPRSEYVVQYELEGEEETEAEAKDKDHRRLGKLKAVGKR